jgi:hypothetical protein
VRGVESSEPHPHKTRFINRGSLVYYCFISVASVAASQPHNARDPYPRTPRPRPRPRPSSGRKPAQGAQRPGQSISLALELLLYIYRNRNSTAALDNKPNLTAEMKRRHCLDSTPTGSGSHAAEEEENVSRRGEAQQQQQLQRRTRPYASPRLQPYSSSSPPVYWYLAGDSQKDLPQSTRSKIRNHLKIQKSNRG